MLKDSSEYGVLRNELLAIFLNGNNISEAGNLGESFRDFRKCYFDN